MRPSEAAIRRLILVFLSARRCAALCVSSGLRCFAPLSKIHIFSGAIAYRFSFYRVPGLLFVRRVRVRAVWARWGHRGWCEARVCSVGCVFAGDGDVASAKQALWVYIGGVLVARWWRFGSIFSFTLWAHCKLTPAGDFHARRRCHATWRYIQNGYYTQSLAGSRTRTHRGSAGCARLARGCVHAVCACVRDRCDAVCSGMAESMCV